MTTPLQQLARYTNQSQQSSYFIDFMGMISSKSLGMDNTGTKDCYSIIQNEINSHADGEVVIYCPSGTYRTDSPIKLGLKTVIMGAGAEQTIFIAPNGNNIIEIDLTPSGNDPVLSGASLINISLRGCGTSTTQKGIYIYNLRATEVAYPSELRYSTFSNLTIYNCGFGINIAAKVGVFTLQDILIHTCHDTGLYSKGTDAFYNNLKVTYCKNGIYSDGGNQAWSNIKAYWNGMCRHGEDYTTTYGIYIAGQRSTFTNIEATENYYNGMVLQYAHNLILNGIVVDANGFGKTQLLGSSYGGNGLIIDNCYSISGMVTADDHNNTNRTQNYGLEVKSNCGDIDLVYTEHNQVNVFPGTNAANSSIRKPSDDSYIFNAITNWTSYVPTFTWETLSPTGVVLQFAKYKVIGKTVILTLKVYASDGNGATNVAVTLPIPPKANGSLITLPAMVEISSNPTVRFIQLRDDGTNNDLKFIYLGTATAGQSFEFDLQICYEAN